EPFGCKSRNACGSHHPAALLSAIGAQRGQPADAETTPTFLQGLKILPSSGRRKQVTGRISTQHRDFAGCEIVIGGRQIYQEGLWICGRSSSPTGCASPASSEGGEMLAFAHIPTGATAN